jgi:hypothetical protein
MKTLYILIISHRVLFIITNASDKRCRENQNTHFVFNIILFSENRVFYENVEKNGGIEQAADGNTTRRVRFAC